VVVKSPAIQRTGDTIKYRVSAFTTANDRVIGDIIDRIPGLQRNELGQITYQGKPINRYYIEGLDLLGSRYGIANESIRYELVDQIEIWERHQPFKILDGIASRNEVALNLKLNKKAKQKWSGQAITAAGLPLPLYEGELSAMKFSGGFQTLNAIKINNTGYNILKELNELSLDINDWEKKFTQYDTQPVLSIPRPNFNFLKEQRQLLNKTIMPYINLLKVGKSGTQWRLNIQAFQDQRINYFGNTKSVFLPGDTINIEETQDWTQRQQGITATLQMEKNFSRQYTHNKTQIQIIGFKQSSWMKGSFPSNQNLNHPFFNFENSFRWMQKNRKQTRLLRIETNTTYFNANTSLIIIPGVFEDAINAGQPLNLIRQRAPVQSFANSSKWAIQNLKDKWRSQWFIKPKIEISHFTSELIKDSSQVQVKMGNPFFNNFQLFAISLQAGWSATRMLGKTEMQAEIPFGLQWLSRVEKNWQRENTKTIPLFLPSLSATRRWSHYTLRLQSKIDIKPFNWQENFTDFVATDYRTVVAYSDMFFIQKGWNNSFAFQFNNPLKGWSAYSSFVYAQTIRNLMPAYQFNGIFVNQVYFNQRNLQHLFNMMAGTGKYFTSLKGGLQWNTQFNIFQTPNVQNSTRFDFVNQIVNTRLKLFTRTIPFLHLEASTQFTLQRSKSTITGISPAASIWIQQFQSTVIILKDKFYVNTLVEWGTTRKNDKKNAFQFIDASINYNSKKIKWRLEGINLLNTNKFILPMTSLNFQQESFIQLRQRNILLKAIFIL
jgi:hypothetical protein